MKAYVMLRTQLMETAGVVDILCQVKGVVAADMTLGPYDAIALVEADNLEALSRTIIHEIRTLPGVLDTLTCLAVQPGK